MADDTRRLRCAIYTRKSTEEGLEKAFNSLDAQREACAAYVLSQQHEGWSLVPEIYDDGGYSGGNLGRPALKQLLDDVKAGRVDVVVVYKIDRLTRSLSDFAKIVEVLDAAQASFVSVTQAFSTTTSMGRLTLNVLLSFAQFEREVGAERIRDKIAASKAKGMWMGGPVALGYRVEDRKLIVVPKEAATVRAIMERYLASESVRSLVEVLRCEGIVSKRTKLRDGSIRGGVPLRRGALCWLLSNRLYVGEVVHKGTIYPGEHDAIVTRELFDAVQARLADRSNPRSATPPRQPISLLPGMIRDEQGRPMSPYHTRNHGRRYRYYASNVNDDLSSPALRLPAGELEAAVRNALAGWLRDITNTRELASELDASSVANLIRCCLTLAGTMVDQPIAEARSLLQQLKLQVIVSREKIAASFCGSALLAKAELIGVTASEVTLIIPTTQASYGHEPRLRLAPDSSGGASPDDRLVELIARGFAARDQLLAMDASQVASTPVTRLRHLERTARMSYLDPSIIRSILGGVQPKQMSARTLWRMADLPLSWAEQRQALHVEFA